MKRAYLMAALALAVTWIVMFLRTRRYPVKRFRTDRALLLVALTLMPFAWYFLTKNHSFNHAFYTSRTLAVSVFAIVSLLTTLLRRKRETEDA